MTNLELQTPDGLPERLAADAPVYLTTLRERAGSQAVGIVGYCLGARLAVRTACLDEDVTLR